VRLTQGAFSFLPDLTDEQIAKQVAFCMAKGWAISIEYTDDPHPRNAYWEMWGLPLFDMADSAAVVFEINSCCKAKKNFYVKLAAFDNTKGTESCALSFILQRPSSEPGFRLVRTEDVGRHIRYTIESYACEGKAEGERY
jgi:ribulose-bisphosphate carboxylase small chain